MPWAQKLLLVLQVFCSVCRIRKPIHCGTQATEWSCLRRYPHRTATSVSICIIFYSCSAMKRRQFRIPTRGRTPRQCHSRVGSQRPSSTLPFHAPRTKQSDWQTHTTANRILFTTVWLKPQKSCLQALLQKWKKRNLAHKQHKPNEYQKSWQVKLCGIKYYKRCRQGNG